MTQNKPEKTITCLHCSLFITPAEPDPCLGQLPGVVYACCGHGLSSSAYVVLADYKFKNIPWSNIPDNCKITLRGLSALDFFFKQNVI